MKKILVLSLIALLSLTGCAGETSAPENSTEVSTNVTSEMAKDVSKETLEEPTVQEESKLTNVKIISTEISEPVGDRTADNVGQENGEYFAMGSDIVKCSDYDNIHVVAELTNNRDILLKTSAGAWSAKMEDGYELGLYQDGAGVNLLYEGDLGKQIQAGSSETVEFDILKEKSVKGDKIILNYTDINYDDTYTEFFQKALSGTSEAELKKDYPQFFDENLHYTFEIPLN